MGEIRMKTIAIADAGNASLAFYEKYIADARRLSGAERVLVITDGDVSREGRLSARDKYERAAMFRAAGADAVAEFPLCALLLAENVHAFSVTCMMQKLECAQQIAIPVAGDAALFEQITSFLFDQPAAYQQRMRALRSQGEELREVLPQVMEQFISGAEAFLKIRSNHLSVEMYNSLRLAYFPAKPVIVPVTLPEETVECTAAQDACLLECLKEKFLSRTEEETLKWANQMYFGNGRADLRLLEAMKADAAGYDEVSRRAEIPGEHAVSLRWHMMACLTGYRKVDSFVCITYNYIPYIRLLDAPDAEYRRHLEQSVGTTLLIDTPQAQNFEQLTDPAKKLFFEIEGRARALFVSAK